MKMAKKFLRKVQPGGLLHIPTPHHQNKEKCTATRPNIREDHNYCTTTVSYAEKKYFTFRMYVVLKFCYETKAARHSTHFTFRLYEYLRQMQ